MGNPIALDRHSPFGRMGNFYNNHTAIIVSITVSISSSWLIFLLVSRNRGWFLLPRTSEIVILSSMTMLSSGWGTANRWKSDRGLRSKRAINSGNQRGREIGKSGMKKAFLFEWQTKNPACHEGQAGHVFWRQFHILLPCLQQIGSVLPPFRGYHESAEMQGATCQNEKFDSLQTIILQGVVPTF